MATIHNTADGEPMEGNMLVTTMVAYARILVLTNV